MKRPAQFRGAVTALALAAALTSRAASAEPPAAPSATEAAASMSTVRNLHSAIELLDGRVLVVGGGGPAATVGEIFDPATGAWTLTSPSLFVHDWPLVTRLCDGRVYVGGRFSTTERDVEIYDPVTDTWLDAGTMKQGHIYGTATLLADCRVLLTGGYNANWTGEVFDPATGAHTVIPGKMSNERFFHSATRLLDGRVLVAAGGVDVNIGGIQTWIDRSSADVYDPATNAWTKVANLKRKRRSHGATLLPDGRVLVTGGTTGGKNDGVDGGEQLATAEIYDPAADTWELLAPQLVTPRSFHTVGVMPNGVILLLGGLDASGSASRQVEAFHDGVFHPFGPLLVDRFQHASAMLPDGRVLVTGGVHQATAEIYSLAQPGGACTSARECASGFCIAGLCCDEACDTGCRRCDVPGHEGTCTRPCENDLHALVCPDGTATCPNEACVPEPCSPYRCDAQTVSCIDECTSVEQCAPGYACDSTGTCVPPPDVSSADRESCSLTADRAARAGDAPGKGGVPASLVAALLACAATLLRRRTRP